MRKFYIRWILPILAMLLIATMLVLTPLLTHASGASTTHPGAKPPITAPSVKPPSHVKPDAYWYN